MLRDDGDSVSGDMDIVDVAFRLLEILVYVICEKKYLLI